MEQQVWENIVEYDQQNRSKYQDGKQ